MAAFRGPPFLWLYSLLSLWSDFGMGDAFIISGTSFLAVAALIPLACMLARKTGFLDLPGGRKKHETAVPPVGGIVIFPVFICSVYALGAPGEFFWFAAALLLLLTTGALDDRFTVPAWIKFGVQFVAAFMIVMPGDTAVEGLGNLMGFGPLWMGWGGIPFAVIAAVLLINAVNLMDGLDGLAAGKGFIVMFWIAICAMLADNAGAAAYSSILMAALAGFLVYNLRHPWREKASVFLGDAGSLALGLSLAWFVIRYSQGADAVMEPVVVAWLLAIPIYDICGQFARRVSQGRHPFDPDHNHFHHHFIHAGMTPGRATAAILAIAFLTGAIGVGGMLLDVPEYVMGYSWVALLLLHIYMSMRPHRFRRLLMRLRGRAAE